jgi:dTDP-4-dehydrorhamnose reductase
MSRRILVVGATGFLGARLSERLRRGHVVLGASRHPCDGDVSFDFWTDEFAEIQRRFGPEIVIFAASVERPNAVGDGSRYPAAVDRFLAALGSVRLVYVSSDAVFDGSRGSYRETDSPAPVNGYGRNLLLFEDRVRATCPDHCIVRPSYLYGFGRGGLDRRLTETRDLLLAGGSPGHPEDLFKSPMEIGEVADVLQTLALSDHIGTVHVSGPRTSVLDFHRDAMEALGFPADRLCATRLPSGSAAARDTSLDSSLMTALTHIVARSVTDALSRDPPTPTLRSHAAA